MSMKQTRHNEIKWIFFESCKEKKEYTITLCDAARLQMDKVISLPCHITVMCQYKYIIYQYQRLV